MQLGRKTYTFGGLLLAVVLLFAVNIASNSLLTASRVDLTENRLYTLTQGTKNILQNLDEPITLRLFLSRDQITRLPGLNSYARRISELLREYERRGAGKLKLRIVDPEPFSEEEDRAVAYGLRGVSMDDGASVLYFGLVGTGATDQEEVIPFFSQSREEFLEYDLTKMVYQLSNPKQKVVGLLSGLPIDGTMPMPGQPMSPQSMARPWAVVQQIRQLFEVETVPTDAEKIPDEVDVLMVIHPKDLSRLTRYAIDQFVLAGGRALVFVDPNSESDRSGPAMLGGGIPGSSDLPELFKQWGIQRVTAKVAGDLQTAEQVRFSNQGRAAVAEYPVWMNLQPTQFNADDVVTGQLGNLVFATPGILEMQETVGITVTPLIQTTPSAMQIDASQLRFVEDPRVLLRQYQPGGKPLMLAARISGNAKTAFPEGKPEPDPQPSDETPGQTPEGEEGDATADADPRPHLSESVEDINLIVVADTDLLNDRFWVQTQNLLGTQIHIPTAANGSFVINALDSLVGSNDLISVRSRGQYSRPFIKVAEIQEKAELQFRQKEQELLNRLRETEEKLVEIENRKQGDDSVILNDAQKSEIEQFRSEKIRIRKELRGVRHELHKNIERLEGWTKFINIGLMPILIGLGGVLIGLYQAKRRKARKNIHAHAQ